MLSDVLELDTARRQTLDITTEITRFCDGQGDGLVHVFAPHATAGLALLEVGSRSEEDLLDAVGRLLPRDDRYAHRHGSPGHGADHVLPAFIAPSLVLPVFDGRPALGTWQSVVFVDLNRDNPRRHVRLSFVTA